VFPNLSICLHFRSLNSSLRNNLLITYCLYIPILHAAEIKNPVYSLPGTSYTQGPVVNSQVQKETQDSWRKMERKSPMKENICMRKCQKAKVNQPYHHPKLETCDLFSLVLLLCYELDPYWKSPIDDSYWESQMRIQAKEAPENTPEEGERLDKEKAVWRSVRYCRIKTTPHVERKDLLRSRLHGCPPHPKVREQWLGWIG
jgi:hypothetical protein